jgi:hypothetical protein
MRHERPRRTALASADADPGRRGDDRRHPGHEHQTIGGAAIPKRIAHTYRSDDGKSVTTTDYNGETHTYTLNASDWDYWTVTYSSVVADPPEPDDSDPEPAAS